MNLWLDFDDFFEMPSNFWWNQLSALIEENQLEKPINWNGYLSGKTSMMHVEFECYFFWFNSVRNDIMKSIPMNRLFISSIFMINTNLLGKKASNAWVNSTQSSSIEFHWKTHIMNNFSYTILTCFHLAKSSKSNNKKMKEKSA